MEIWDYMDPKPSLDVRPYEGNSLEEIETKTKDLASHLNQMPWSGTIKFVAILDKKEAEDFIKEQIKKEVSKWQEDSLSFINQITKSYLDCYEN